MKFHSKQMLMRIMCCTLSMMLMCTYVCCAFTRAYADVPSINDLLVPNSTLQSSADLYNTALSEQERIRTEIDRLQLRNTQIEEQLPELRRLCETCMKAQYKQQSSTMTLLSCLMNSNSISDSLAMLETYNMFYEYNADSINRCIALIKEKKSNIKEIENNTIALEEATKIADENLKNAIKARETVRDEAFNAQQNELSVANPESVKAADATKDNVDWNVKSKQEFVDKWAVRIDKYLEGTPTAGNGKFYAQYAWDFGVDPRWAPAISNTESSRGYNCFRPFNAWGFGQYDFTSWEEGIKQVISTLSSSLYGSYLTKKAASIYCPPTWQDWYKHTADEMARIQIYLIKQVNQHLLTGSQECQLIFSRTERDKERLFASR